MKNFHLPHRSLSACLAVFGLISAILVDARSALAEPVKTLDFPVGASLGLVTEEAITADYPFLRTVKKPLGQARGHFNYPSGSKLHVEVTYTVIQDPSSLSYLNRPDIVALQFKSLPIDDAFVARLKDFKYLRKIQVDETDVTDACLKTLGAMPNLAEINISQTEIKGSGFKYLGSLPNLLVLHVNHTQLTPAYLNQYLLPKSLRILDYSNTGVDDTTVGTVSGLTALEELNLDHSKKLTDKGIACLGGLTHLRYFDVSSTGITFKGLADLKQLPLKSLGVINLHLAPEQMTRLREIYPKLKLKTGSNRYRVEPDMFKPLH